jgi:hypothetical protein
VADGGTIYKYNGSWSNAGFPGIPNANPLGIAVDNTGKVYVTDGSSDNVYYSSGGAWGTISLGSGGNASQIATDGTSNLVASFHTGDSNYKYSIISLPGLSVGAAQSGTIQGVGAFGSGIWVNSNGTVTQVVGGSTNGSVVGTASGIALSGVGTVFYHDGAVVSTSAGANLGCPLTYPLGIGNDPSGAIYAVGFDGTFTARVYKYNGSWTELTGYPGSTPYGVTGR